MLVYGQPQFQERFHILLRHLALRCQSTDRSDLDELRILLIQVGQLEQAVADCDSCEIDWPHAKSEVTCLTDLAAELFVRAWMRQCRAADAPEPNDSALQRIMHGLSKLEASADPLLEVKVPEGFEFYALFSEQYCSAALAWSEKHSALRPSKPVVVGIRSIGTTLSAVVSETLRSTGWRPCRETVRPRGHPYSRTVDLENPGLFQGRPVLIVDEGPGLSGSSMAGTARALLRAGCGMISFLPGHGEEPGGQASGETRQLWTYTPRYCVSLEQMRWKGLTLAQCLATRSEGLLRGTGKKPHSTQVRRSGDIRTADLSGGMWRRLVFPNETQWPAVAARFERTKFLCRSGAGAVLWKFSGLGCLANSRGTAYEQDGRLASLEARRLRAEPIDQFRGFTAFSWIKGERLSAAQLHKRGVLPLLGAYLAACAGPPLSNSEACAGIERLTRILCTNLAELGAEEEMEGLDLSADLALMAEPMPRYTDGRMAPHEWVRTRTGEIIKTDYTGHQSDHTIVGEQSLLWDIAAALVEWQVPAKDFGLVLSPILAAGITVDMKMLNFYRTAYAAFRLGLFSLCQGEMSPDEPEAARVRGAIGKYGAVIQAGLRKRFNEKSRWLAAPAHPSC